MADRSTGQQGEANNNDNRNDQRAAENCRAVESNTERPRELREKLWWPYKTQGAGLPLMPRCPSGLPIQILRLETGKKIQEEFKDKEKE